MTKLIGFLLRLIASVAVPLVAMGAGSRSPDWQTKSNEYKKHNGSCRACGATTKLEIHHIFPFHLYPELEMVEDYWITLCRDCHYLFGHLKDWKSWNPTVREDAAKFLVQVKNRPHLKEAKNGK